MELPRLRPSGSPSTSAIPCSSLFRALPGATGAGSATPQQAESTRMWQSWEQPLLSDSWEMVCTQPNSLSPRGRTLRQVLHLLGSPAQWYILSGLPPLPISPPQSSAGVSFTSQMNYLISDPCFRICFCGTQPRVSAAPPQQPGTPPEALESPLTWLICYE